MISGKSRTVLVVFLFLSLTAPFVATYGWLKYEKHQVKRTIKWKMIAGMQREDLELLKFSKEEAQTELYWEHSREFEYNNHMYDVVETITVGDSIFYRCWPDDEETVLNRQLEQLVAQVLGDDPQRSENHLRLVEFVKTLYCPDALADQKIPAFYISKLPVQAVFHYHSISCTPPAPPPESVS